MQVMIELADTLASHAHSGVVQGMGSTQAPNQAGEITGHGSDSNAIKNRLNPITQA